MIGCIGLLIESPLLINGAALWRGNLFGDIAHKLLEGRNGRGFELGTGDSDIGVEVCDGAGKRSGMLLSPFRSSPSGPLLQRPRIR